MNMKAILFDLDGTLLPMDQDVFVKTYFGLLAKKLAPMGFEPNLLIKSLWEGVGAMVKNNGEKRNGERFWDLFAQVYGKDAEKVKSVLEAFYTNEFHGAKIACGYKEDAKQVVEMAAEKGRKVVLATNPIFPAVATQSRMNWAGLNPEQFYLYTTYEDFHYSKPNPNYYLEVLEKIDCKPEECLMIGNDVAEDMIAAALGMNVFLLTDCLINKKEEDITKYPHGSFKELKTYIKEL